MMRNGMWHRRLRVVAAALGSLALIAVPGTSSADDNNGSVPVDIATRDRIFEQIRNLSIPGMDGLSVGLDPVRQKIGVTIFAPKGLPAVVIGRLAFGDNVSVDVVEADGPSPQENVAGGEDLLYVKSDGGVGRCTLGFAVGMSGGKSGFLTAGHCFNLKPVEEQQAYAGPDSVPVTGTQMDYESSDWGIYTLDGSPDEDQAMPEIVTDDDTFPIEGIAQPTMDRFICKHGITTGTTCGTVTYLDVKAIYRAKRDSQGRIVQPEVELEGLVQTDACTEPGDSGGPVYAPHGDKVMAVGITSGAVLTEGAESDRCLEVVGRPSVSYMVPLSATPAGGTDSSASVFLKVAP